MFLENVVIQNGVISGTRVSPQLIDENKEILFLPLWEKSGKIRQEKARQAVI